MQNVVEMKVRLKRKLQNKTHAYKKNFDDNKSERGVDTKIMFQLRTFLKHREWLL